MIHLENKTVGNIVTENVNTAKVFHKYHIDFGFNGDIVLKKVCKKKKLDIAEVILELNGVNKNHFYLKDYNNWHLNLLITFLTDVHHLHKQDDLMLLKKLANQVNIKYGETYHFINTVVNSVISIADDLLMKMNYEETVIYPHIKKLVAIRSKPKGTFPLQAVLSENAAIIEKQRLIISEKFKVITKFTNNYHLPKDVCKTYTVFYYKLKKFQFYLQEHNHIERNILLPKALQLEKSLLDSA